MSKETPVPKLAGWKFADVLKNTQPPPDLELFIDGNMATFKMPRSYADIQALAIAATEWAEQHSETPFPGLPCPMPKDKNALMFCYTLAATSVEPKLSQKEALIICQLRGDVFGDWVNRFNAYSEMARLNVSVDRIDAAKKDLRDAP